MLARRELGAFRLGSRGNRFESRGQFRLAGKKLQADFHGPKWEAANLLLWQFDQVLVRAKECLSPGCGRPIAERTNVARGVSLVIGEFSKRGDVVPERRQQVPKAERIADSAECGHGLAQQRAERRLA